MGANNLGLGLLLEAKDLASGVLKNFSKQLLEVVGGTTEAGKAIKASTKEIGLGLGIFAVGAGGLSALNPSLEAATKFSNGIAEITTLTDEASLGFDSVYDSVLNMNAAFGGGTEQQTKALYDGISAGAANAAEATDLLTASNKLAVAGKAEVGVALDGLTSSLNAYGVSFSSAAEFSDALFVAVQKGKTTIPELSSVIGRVAPTASALGISFSELNAALAAVTAKGLKTEEAATGIKAALSNIINPAGDAAAEASRLGIKFTAAEVRSKGFAGVLKEITGSARFNKDSLAKLFSSVEGLNAVLALTANDSQKFNEALTAMEHKGGATEKAFGIMSEQLANSEKRFAGVKENASILIGDALIPMKAALVGIGIAVVETFNKIPTPIRNFMVQAFAVGSALLAVVGGIIAIKGAIGLVAPALSALGVSWGGIVASVGPVIGILAVLAVAIYGIKRAYDENLGGFADRVNSSIASVKLAFGGLAQLFQSGAFSGAVMTEIDKAENSGVKSFAINLFLLGSRIQAFFGDIGAGFTGSLDEVQPAVEQLMASGASISKAFSGGFQVGGAAENAQAFDRWSSAGERLGQILAGVASNLLIVVSWAGQLVAGIVDGFSGLGGTFSGLWDALGELRDGVEELFDSFGGLGGQGLTVGEVFYALGRGIAGIFGGIVGIVSGVVSGIGGILRGLGNIIGGVVDVVGGLIDGDWNRVWLGAKKIVFGVWQAVVAAVGGIVQAIAGAIDAIAGAIGRKTNLAATVKSFREGLEKDARSYFGVPGGGGKDVAPGPAPAAAGEQAATTALAVAAAASQADRTGGAGQFIGPPPPPKPPMVTANTTVIVQVNGEDIPSTATTRTQVGAGVPVAPAGV